MINKSSVSLTIRNEGWFSQEWGIAPSTAWQTIGISLWKSNSASLMRSVVVWLLLVFSVLFRSEICDVKKRHCGHETWNMIQKRGTLKRWGKHKRLYQQIWYLYGRKFHVAIWGWPTLSSRNSHSNHLHLSVNSRKNSIYDTWPMANLLGMNHI